MSRKTHFYRLILTIGSVIAALGMASNAFALDPALVVHEGNTSCNNYSSNQTIFSIGTTSPVPTGETITDDEVEITYRIVEEMDGVQALEFSNVQTVATPPADEGVNIVILKGEDNIAMSYIWGSDAGQTQWPPADGSSVSLKIQGGQTTIEKVVFCYGLGIEPPPPPPEPVTIAACSATVDIGNDAPAGTVGGDVCEGAEEFECDIANGTIECCACNPDTTVSCILGETCNQSETGGIIFGDINTDILIGTGSPTRVCIRTGTRYYCYYRY